MSGVAKQKVMSKTRIESFSDGVFSIILTLLVFNFKIPQISGADLNQELYTKLFAMYPYVVTYVLSFIMISMFWVAHHNLFHSLKHSDATLLWLNNIFLLFLAFIPFPTQVLGAYPEVESAAIFFGIAMVITSLSFSLLRYYCYYRGSLILEGISKLDMQASMIKGLVGTGLYFVAILISALSPDITLTMYALIPFLFFIPVHAKQKKGKLAKPSNDSKKYTKAKAV